MVLVKVRVYFRYGTLCDAGENSSFLSSDSTMLTSVIQRPLPCADQNSTIIRSLDSYLGRLPLVRLNSVAKWQKEGDFSLWRGCLGIVSGRQSV